MSESVSSRTSSNETDSMGLVPLTTAPYPPQPIPSSSAYLALETRLDAFFTSPPFIADQNSNHLPLPNPEPTDPSTLTSTEIERQCEDKAFQILKGHYELYCVGFAGPFMPASYLTKAQDDARKQAIEWGQLLLKLSTSKSYKKEDEQKRIIRSVEANLEKINASIKERNDKMKNNFMKRNQHNIKTEFENVLNLRYHYLVFGPTNPAATDATPAFLSKFYHQQKMRDSIQDETTRSKANCNAFHDLLLRDTKSDDDKLIGQLFDRAKNAIEEYGTKLLSQNEENKKHVDDHLKKLIVSFESECKEVITSDMFMARADIAEMVKTKKEACLQQIIAILREYAGDNDAFMDDQMTYDKLLKESEKQTLSQCVELASTLRIDTLTGIADRADKNLRLSEWYAPIQMELQRIKTRGDNQWMEMIKDLMEDSMNKVKQILMGIATREDDAATAATTELGAAPVPLRSSLNMASSPRKIFSKKVQPVVPRQVKWESKQQEDDDSKSDYDSDETTLLPGNVRKHKNYSRKHGEHKSSSDGKRSRKE